MTKAEIGKWVSFSSKVLRGGIWQEDGHMELMFVSGKVYPYEGVPRGVWFGLCHAPSHGVYYNAEIKGQYA